MPPKHVVLDWGDAATAAAAERAFQAIYAFFRDTETRNFKRLSNDIGWNALAMPCGLKQYVEQDPRFAWASDNEDTLVFVGGPAPYTIPRPAEPASAPGAKRGSPPADDWDRDRVVKELKELRKLVEELTINKPIQSEVISPVRLEESSLRRGRSDDSGSGGRGKRRSISRSMDLSAGPTPPPMSAASSHSPAPRPPAESTEDQLARLERHLAEIRQARVEVNSSSRAPDVPRAPPPTSSSTTDWIRQMYQRVVSPRGKSLEDRVRELEADRVYHRQLIESLTSRTDFEALKSHFEALEARVGAHPPEWIKDNMMQFPMGTIQQAVIRLQTKLQLIEEELENVEAWRSVHATTTKPRFPSMYQ